MTESVTVVIVASRPEPLRRCLESLASQPGFEECLLVLNGRNEACSRTARDFAGRIAGLRLVAGGGLPPGRARNLALAAARGGLLCFLDDDVTVPPGYFSGLRAKAALHPGVAAIGGPNHTPPGSPLFERCVGHVLASRFFSGGTAPRAAGLPADGEADERSLILCNLSFRAEALRRHGLRFDDELPRNEENLLLEQLRLRGETALHSPSLFVYHERRAALKGFLRQCLLSGRGRAEMTLKLPASLRLPCLAPLLLFILAAALPVFPELSAAPAAAYAALAALNALLESSRRGEPAAAAGWIWLLTVGGHLSYGAGLLWGLGRRIRTLAPLPRGPEALGDRP